MKIIISGEYKNNVLETNTINNLKNLLSKTIEGLKVNDIYISISDKPELNNKLKDKEIMILEDIEMSKNENSITKKPLIKNTSRKEKLISDKGKWDSYDSLSNMPTL